MSAPPAAAYTTYTIPNQKRLQSILFLIQCPVCVNEHNNQHYNHQNYQPYEDTKYYFIHTTYTSKS